MMRSTGSSLRAAVLRAGFLALVISGVRGANASNMGAIEKTSNHNMRIGISVRQNALGSGGRATRRGILPVGGPRS